MREGMYVHHAQLDRISSSAALVSLNHITTAVEVLTETSPYIPALPENLEQMMSNQTAEVERLFCSVGMCLCDTDKTEGLSDANANKWALILDCECCCLAVDGVMNFWKLLIPT